MDETLAARRRRGRQRQGAVRRRVSNYSGWQMTPRGDAGRRRVPGRAPAGVGADGVLAAGARHRARGRPRRAGASAWASCRGRRWVAGCSPASTATACRPTPAGRTSTRAAWVQVYLDERVPSDRRRGVARRPRASASRRTEVALAWVRDRPGVVAPILGARTASQLRRRTRVGGARAARGDRHALDDVSGTGPGLSRGRLGSAPLGRMSAWTGALATWEYRDLSAPPRHERGSPHA